MNRPQNQYVQGLGTLRIVLAMWVVFGHYGAFPLMQGVDESWPPAHVFRAIYSNSSNGPAAVIVFFVISGFCIHFPFRHNYKFQLAPYYLRRNVRIILPAIIAVVLAGTAGTTISFLGDAILWSLVCEEIYYCIYPLLRLAAARIGWLKLTVAAWLASTALVIIAGAGAGNYPAYGIAGNWLLGLPCWLMGCLLAEHYDGLLVRSAPALRVLWLWRAGALVLATSLSIVRFHAAIPYPWLLNLMALYAYFWLAREILVAEKTGPSFLETAGAFSYSVYLFHPHGQAVAKSLAVGSVGYILDWVIRNGFIVIFCYAFYLAIERPSHRLARWIGKTVSAKLDAAAALKQVPARTIATHGSGTV